MTLEALDQVPEPSELIDDEMLTRFYQRQDRLAKILSSDVVIIETSEQRLSIEPKPRTFWSLPAIFWAQLFAGFGALVISGWVWALRPDRLDSNFFAISGVSILVSALAAAIYSTRVLALPASVFQTLSAINLIGAYSFGMAMIGLFLIYPVRLKGWKFFLVTSVVIFSLWSLFATLGMVPAALGANLIMLSEMIGICLVIAIQYFSTGNRPEERATLTWFGLSVFVGAGAFIALTVTPLLLGGEVFIEQGYAFLFFLVIYLGLAAGLRRYRLFDIGEWGFRILFYMAGVFVLVALDTVLVYVISMDRFPALGFSLLIVGFLYLPFREKLWRIFVRRSSLEDHEIFHAVIDVAFETTDNKRADQWIKLVRRLFEPLEWQILTPSPLEPEIRQNGLELAIPAISTLPGVLLRSPWNGRGLFGTLHVNIARQLYQLMTYVENSRNAYEQGVAEERQRIARDMHDNIGAQLMSVLHNRNAERKDALVRETLSDLRDIINDHSRQALTFEEALADIRMETAERLAAADIELEWSVEVDQSPPLFPQLAHGLRSIIREATSNILKHAGAGSATVTLGYGNGVISLEIRDDGRGLVQVPGHNGNGLGNMQARVTRLGGTISFPESPTGLILNIRLPYSREGRLA
ncbi:ATP-binding protein [Emcibacter sp.]|uniref:ATP-binding protein n=1 Tax=Emcibacter sp. TaxID=1979954 RepID=UPI002AA6E708|nr:ATP-binding protein [Emcibacter sp.]